MEAAMGESTEEALDSSNSRSSTTCRTDMHLNGEVNGSCGNNADMCGIISRDIAPSKLMSDVGNDSVGSDSNHSVLSSSVGVENGNAGISDSDGEDVDMPSDDSCSRVREDESAELATGDGMLEDCESPDEAVADDKDANPGDTSVSSPTIEDFMKIGSAGMYGSHETDLVGTGDDSRETDSEGEDVEIGAAVRDDDAEEFGVEDIGDDLHETSLEGKGGDLQETSLEGRTDDIEESDLEDIEDNMQESGVEDKGDNETGREVGEDEVLEAGQEDSDDGAEDDIKGRSDDVHETGIEERGGDSQETGTEEIGELQETSFEGRDSLQKTDTREGDDSVETGAEERDVSKDTANEADKIEDSKCDESMEVDDDGVGAKPVPDTATKESDQDTHVSVVAVSSKDKDRHTSVEATKQDGSVAGSCVSADSKTLGSEHPAKPKVAESSSSDKASVKSEDTPGKIKKARKSLTPMNVTPRRSSRNLSKTQKTYSEHEEDPDIEEITPQDPLADPLAREKEPSKPRTPRNKTTIVVNDTKRLVEIAAGSKPSKGGKKEPTLVIIDTNSILSGRGPVPVAQNVHSAQPSSSSPSPGYSVLPIALPAQGMYPTSITPSASPTVMPNPLRTSTPIVTVPQPRPPPQILPSLTDDMYVVEAPSFIVPYVYEKPPLKPLKEFVEGLGKELEKIKEELKASEAYAKASEESEKTEESDEEEDPVKGKEAEDTERDHEKSHSNTSNEAKDVKLTNAKDSVEKIDGENSDNSKQAKKADPEDVKNESKSDVNGDVDSESKEGSKEDKEKGDSSKAESSKPATYFDNPLGKFFMQIGVNLVQEFVQTDLLRSQKKKRDREGGRGASVTQFAISSLLKNLELSKENNEPFHLSLKKCDYCNFKTESSLVMAQHLETPHMKNYVYRCNFCTLEVRSPHDILFHMEAEHNVRGRLERAPAFHQCPNCPFEDNQKGKLSRHLISCLKKFKPEKNQEPPLDWEPPAKIPRVSRNRPSSMGIAYQALANKQVPQHPLLPKLVPSPQMSGSVSSSGRGRGRPPLHSRYLGDVSKIPVQRPIAPTQIRQSMLYRSTASGSPMLVPTTYQISGNQIYQVVGGQGQMMPVMSSGITPVPRIALMSPASASSQSATSSTVSSAASPTPVALVPSNAITIQNAHKNNPTAKLLQQPSISITPLPRQPAATLPPPSSGLKQASTTSGGKATFVICEICDGYIKDLEQLRNHMQWIHKVKIHPKMIYNRPPLNCQKCQFRFFTDQGLERHLLGSHGLVTSSMQEAANKGKDGGRCPVCGRVYQWKLLNHVARDHNMTLKPAHLSYKCTVCTATFGMYKQFENHVYSAHSVVAKRVMDKKTTSPSQQASRAQGTSGDSLLKPLKINDEITIIPQPARPRPGPASRTGAVSAATQAASNAKVWQCDDCEATFDGPTGFAQFTAHVKRRHLRRCSVRLCRLDACPTCKRRHVTGAVLEWLRERSGVDVIELSDDEVVIGQGRSEITITKVSCAPGPKRFKQRLQQAKVQVIEIEDSPVKAAATTEENGEDSLTAVKERLRRRKSLEISQIDSDGSPHPSEDLPSKKRRKVGDD